MTPTKRAQELISQGYHQVSRRHRLLARLPNGKTGKEALYEAEMETKQSLWNRKFWESKTRQWVNALGEIPSTDQYLRVFAQHVKVPQSVFDEFRRLGGGTVR